MSRPTLEGSLTKWTNVVKGWQHRWFVLDENAAVLSYYTSREKMTRGVRRGCVRLKGAVLGIDDEEDGNFTVTTDTKTFHFQARDAGEREVWVRALEDTILRHAPFPHKHPLQPIVVLRKHMPHHLLKVHFECDDGSHESSMRRFDVRIAQADVLLQMLIEQTGRLQATARGLELDPEMSTRLERMANNYKQMLDAVKLAIVLLQILKNTIDPVHGIGLVASQSKFRLSHKLLTKGSQSAVSRGEGSSTSDSPHGGSVELGAECEEGREGRPRVGVIDVARGEGMTLIVTPEIVPETSYSSSDDDDFFDAEELHSPSGPRPNTPVLSNLSGGARSVLPRKGSDATETATSRKPRDAPFKRNDGTLDYDALYEEDNGQDDISMEHHGSLITHLLSQVKIGMDLTKVVLPTFILETRSLLEMYADYFAHPDLFTSIADGQTARDRLVRVVRWYVSAYHAGRKSGVAKKPYNPILGEVFLCHWDVPGMQRSADMADDVPEGPVPWCSSDQLTFVAEQVSHHPPVSAFYAEHPAKRISFNAFVYTKSKFLGLSVAVHNVGHGIVHVLDHGEQYKVTFPSGYGRSILTVPWIELGGSVTITCAQTGYHANVEFLTKPFYGGKRHQIAAELFAPGEKKPFQTVAGEWNGAMHVSYSKTGRSELFVDVGALPAVRKRVRPVAEQRDNESRRLWKEVTAGLKLNDIEKATNAKTALEQKQRDEAKHRKDHSLEWQTELFAEQSGEWFYKAPLGQRSSHSSHTS